MRGKPRTCGAEGHREIGFQTEDVGRHPSACQEVHWRRCQGGHWWPWQEQCQGVWRPEPEEQASRGVGGEEV